MSDSSVSPDSSDSPVSPVSPCEGQLENVAAIIVAVAKPENAGDLAPDSLSCLQHGIGSDVGVLLGHG